MIHCRIVNPEKQRHLVAMMVLPEANGAEARKEGSQPVRQQDKEEDSSRERKEQARFVASPCLGNALIEHLQNHLDHILKARGHELRFPTGQDRDDNEDKHRQPSGDYGVSNGDTKDGEDLLGLKSDFRHFIHEFDFRHHKFPFSLPFVNCSVSEEDKR